MNNDWNEEDNFNLALSQRTEELYRVPNYEASEDGLIEASVMPLRDLVVFPHMVAPIFIGRKSIAGCGSGRPVKKSNRDRSRTKRSRGG